MKSETDKIDEAFSSGKITKTEQIAQKEAVSKKYETIINEKIENEQTQLEDITKTAVTNSVYNTKPDTTKYRNSFSCETTDGLKFKFKKRVKSPKYYINTSTLTVSYAFANLTKDKGSFNPFENDSEMRIGNSHSVEVQFRKDKQLGSFTSPWILRYGLAYRTDTYMPKRPQVFIQDNSELFLDDFQQGTLKRSKLRNVYLTLPVEFQLYLNPKYTEYDGKQYLDVRKKMWKVGVGAYAGVNTRSIVKVKYYNENGNFKKYDYTLDDGVNAFLFGGKFSFGYGGVNLFIKKDFTPIFNDKANIPNRNGIQVGIEIANIDF
ncbi:PorT family protein [Chryseobacterium sp. FH1]|uniref:PorT family protein n=1 Tax=Chryseobacterium sp. FH1 TaxID=1233951 RepID=UPI000A8572F4|nr:PorT family protein [Chryseobacterium sp. FH1]